MAKTWTEDNPKAGLMARKRAALVEAALAAFLQHGYAEASVNHIAAAAGVSIKTLYRHFDSKDDLFAAVMAAACGKPAPGSSAPLPDEPEPPWMDLPPPAALPLAGADYLRHALSYGQLALYRVVVRDAHRFPELGRRYWDQVLGGRDAAFVSYLDRWGPKVGWTVLEGTVAAHAFAGLLRSGPFDEALLEVRPVPDAEVVRHAARAAEWMLALLEREQF